MKIMTSAFGLHISDAENAVSILRISPEDCWDLADKLENLNTPGNHQTPLRKLTDALWALGNDTDAFLIHSTSATP